MHMEHNTHSHSAGHGHNHTEKPATPPKDLALLKYMLEHNRQHAHELSEMGERLNDAGSEGAAELIRDAVHYFAHANEKLDEAVALITEG